MKFPIIKPKKGNGIPGYAPGGTIPRLGIVDNTGKPVITDIPPKFWTTGSKHCKKDGERSKLPAFVSLSLLPEGEFYSPSRSSGTGLVSGMAP